MIKELIAKAVQEAVVDMSEDVMLLVRQIEGLQFKDDNLFINFDDGTEQKVKGVSKSELMGEIGLAGDSIEDLYFEGEYLYYKLDDGKPKKVKGFKKSDFQGKDGKDGVNGKDGRDGINGKDGKDSTLNKKEYVKIAENEVNIHNKEFDHKLLHDSHLVGTKEVDESNIDDGKVLTYNKKKNKIVYDSIQQFAQQLSPFMFRSGYQLPSQEGNTGKVLTSGGTVGSETWETPSGGGGSPGGSSGQLQWNNAGSFDGVSGSTVTSNGYLTLAATASTTGSPTQLTLTGAAHTTLTASTEATDINLNLARTVQFSTGALTTQRAIRIQAPTYAFVGASTITNAITLDIASPIAGTNATITNSSALGLRASASTHYPLTTYNNSGTATARIDSTGKIYFGDLSNMSLGSYIHSQGQYYWQINSAYGKDFAREGSNGLVSYANINGNYPISIIGSSAGATGDGAIVSLCRADATPSGYVAASVDGAVYVQKGGNYNNTVYSNSRSLYLKSFNGGNAVSGNSNGGSGGNIYAQIGAGGTSTGTGVAGANGRFAVIKETGSAEIWGVSFEGKVSLLATNTAAGTTGAQTINKPSGTVNFAAAATSLVVTNSLVTTSSIVMAVVRTNDTTAYIKNVVPASGSFTINLGAAATAETSVGFIVYN